MNEETSNNEVISKAIDLASGVGKFLKTIVGPAASEIGLMLGDSVRFYRYKNLVRIAEKVEAIEKVRQLEGKAIEIPMRYAIPIIEFASKDDDDVIQNRWALLIANAIDSNVKLDIKKAYLDVLASLEPLDVLILDFLSAKDIEEKYPFIAKSYLNANLLAETLNQNVEELKISLQSLYRLGCIIDAFEQTLDSMDYGYAGFRVNNPKSNFRLSHFGHALMHACSEPMR